MYRACAHGTLHSSTPNLRRAVLIYGPSASAASARFFRRNVHGPECQAQSLPNPAAGQGPHLLVMSELKAAGRRQAQRPYRAAPPPRCKLCAPTPALAGQIDENDKRPPWRRPFSREPREEHGVARVDGGKTALWTGGRYVKSDSTVTPPQHLSLECPNCH